MTPFNIQNSAKPNQKEDTTKAASTSLDHREPPSDHHDSRGTATHFVGHGPDRYIELLTRCLMNWRDFKGFLGVRLYTNLGRDDVSHDSVSIYT